MYNNFRKSNLEIKRELQETIKNNEIAIEAVERWRSKCTDVLHYNENDEEVKESLKTLEYIKFCLLYLQEMYEKAYKKVGGKH